MPAGKPRHTRLSPAAETTGMHRGARKHQGTGGTGDRPTGPAPVLTARSLSKTFRAPGREDFTAVSDVGFELLPGQTLGVVGESGSGKTTTARMVLGLLAPDSGSVELFGEPWSALRESERRATRPKLGAIYQDPLSSFDPRMSVERLLADALSAGATRNPRAHRARIDELLGLVGLETSLASRNPATLSGGQRQRLAIARALAPEPRVLICDEPVSALDVSIQAQVLDLLDDLQRKLGLSYLFISHDLAVIRHMSDRVLVMRGGCRR